MIKKVFTLNGIYLLTSIIQGSAEFSY